MDRWSYLRSAVMDGWASMQDDEPEADVADAMPADRRRNDKDPSGSLPEADERRSVGAVRVEIDHFDGYLRAHGVDAGAAVLLAVADIVRASVRDGDVVYRFGGEGFCVLLPATTDDEARDVAERLRAAVEAAPFDGEDVQPGGRLTVSVGLALTEGGTLDDMLRSADGALLEAKDAGRNRVVVNLGPEGPGLLLS